MSESIHAGYLPLWNPYINFGIPAYGDMSGGYWSPMTWLIASTIGYNAYTITLELLLYVLLGGLGVYSLAGCWTPDTRIRTMAGIAYMCCGYNIGHLQHFNWVSGAAFLPWCFFAYVALLEKFSLKNAVRAALLFYMLIASAHPGITIGSMYFFSAYLVYRSVGVLKEKNRFLAWRQLLISNGSLLTLLTVLSAGLIIGYLDIIPHFVRGEKISLDASLANPTTIQSWISLVLPFATVKNDTWFNTDISMRNSYFGLGMMLFFLLALFRQQTRFQSLMLFTGLFFAILSAGGFLKIFAYKYLPLIGFVRLNGEFRIFAILCFIIVATIELDRFSRQKNNFSGKIRVIYYLIELMLFAVIAVGLYEAFHLKKSFIFSGPGSTQGAGLTGRLKTFIDTLSFYDLLWMQGTLQLFLLWGIKWCLRSQNINLLGNIIIADLVLASLLNIPFTGVGKSSTQNVQDILNHSPKGIPLPPDQLTYQPAVEQEALVGDWDWYSKQIAVNSVSAYPIALKNSRRYFNSLDSGQLNFSTNQAWIFVDSLAEGTTLNNLFFSPNKVSASLDKPRKGHLVYKQNFYPHWVYSNGNEDSTKQAVVPYELNFMAVPISPATQRVTISFEPIAVLWGMIVSFVSFLACGVLWIFLTVKRTSPS